MKKEQAMAIDNMQMKFDESQICVFWDMYADRQMHMSKKSTSHASQYG